MFKKRDAFINFYFLSSKQNIDLIFETIYLSRMSTGLLKKNLTFIFFLCFTVLHVCHDVIFPSNSFYSGNIDLIKKVFIVF